MKIKYENLTDEELDKLSAEKFDLPLKLEFVGSSYMYVENIGFLNPVIWCPCCYSNNQCERFLFPKLEAKGFRIVERRLCVNMLPFYEITIYSCQTELKRNIVAQKYCEYYEKKDTGINRTKTMTCLIALPSS